MLPMITRFNDNNWFPTLFNDFFDTEAWPVSNRKNNVTAPAVNVIEAEKTYKVEVAAPGMTKDDFSVKIDSDNNLVICMEKKSEPQKKEEAHADNGRYLRREFSYSKYQQAFTLPDDVEAEKISATMADGVLTIDLPKKEAAPVVDTTRLINIQ